MNTVTKEVEAAKNMDTNVISSPFGEMNNENDTILPAQQNMCCPLSNVTKNASKY